MDAAAKFLDNRLEDQIEAIAVAIVEEDRIAGVAAEGDMIESGRIMNAKSTGHAGIIATNVRKSNLTPLVASYEYMVHHSSDCYKN